VWLYWLWVSGKTRRDCRPGAVFGLIGRKRQMFHPGTQNPLVLTLLMRFTAWAAIGWLHKQQRSFRLSR
jgi:hypothetical protein